MRGISTNSAVKYLYTYFGILFKKLFLVAEINTLTVDISSLKMESGDDEIRFGLTV